ncbi:MAG: hypothetical protein PHQ14_10245 [Chromatiales bacterium]|nr:hypothetical protein [Chromatiales bacterium]MDX9768415.1 hypothetical protein [Ectothiorhodospiraceae bacterium]
MAASVVVAPVRASWPVSLEDLPTLFGFLDDQALPVEIGVRQGASTVAIRAACVRCRQRDRCLHVEGPDSSLCIDLDRLAGARAVSRLGEGSRSLSLELSCADPREALTITGPATGTGGGGEIWCLLLEALAPEGWHDRSRAERCA